MLFRKDKEKKKEIDEVKAAVNIDEPQPSEEENEIEYQEETPLFDDDEIFGTEEPEEAVKDAEDYKKEDGKKLIKTQPEPERPIHEKIARRHNYESSPVRASSSYEESVWEPRYQNYNEYPRQEGAPLFVKVEKYQEIIGRLQEMRLFVSGVKDIFTIMQEIDAIRSEALNVLKVSVQRLEKSVIEMDSDLLRPKGMPVAMPHGQSEAKHIEASLSELQKQLNDLKRELQNID